MMIEQLYEKSMKLLGRLCRNGIIGTNIHEGRECIIWKGGLRSPGYAGLRICGKTHSVHRVIYQILVGEIPQGMEIDHKCEEKLCYNPMHLELSDRSKNNLRGNPHSGQAHPKCPHGRCELDRRGYCRMCIRERAHRGYRAGIERRNQMVGLALAAGNGPPDTDLLLRLAALARSRKCNGDGLGLLAPSAHQLP